MEQETQTYGKVSIIMPSYNTAKYIDETINSVLKQTYTDWELIIVDDCSTDETDAIVSKYLTDERIKYLKNEVNSGAAITRNRALREATGKWIAFLDSDDLWQPEKLEKQLKFMADGGVAFSFSDYEVIDDVGSVKTVFVPRKDLYNYKDILKSCSIGCLTVIYNAEILGKVFMPENAPKREDIACWLSILKKGIMGFCLHASLAKYRVHSHSVSSNKVKMLKYQWRLYRKTERLTVCKSFCYLISWAFNGFFKYRR